MTERPDPDEERLRAALRWQADRVSPRGDGLARIRERTGAPRRWWRPVLVLALTGALAVAAGGVLALRGDRGLLVRPAPPAAPTTGATPTAGSPSPSGTSGTPAPVTSVRLPVYYVVDTGRGARLVREYVAADLPAGGDRVAAALGLMFDRAPAHPAYRSGWPAGVSVRSVTRQGDTATVDLSGAAAQPPGRAPAPMAVQELVYTVTATEPALAAVRLTVDGQPVGSLWGQPLPAPPYRRAAQLTVLSPVWITEPAYGATVSSPVTVRGTAATFEGNVQWEVRRDGTVVQRGFTTTSAGGPARGDWSVTLSLAPGSYTVRAFELDSGTGSLLAEDVIVFITR